jgi:glutamate formiminotransferase / 5-formyltetrahydrofolate cyclo-ligase
LLLAVPNVSTGPEGAVLGALDRAFGEPVLDIHSDAVHARTVYTLAGRAAELEARLLAGAEAAIAAIDLRTHEGAHPRIGALDVCPIVYTEAALREPATSLALRVGEQLGELGLPVFLYGDLAASEQRRERHFFRRGGIEALAERMAGKLGGEPPLRPDFGPDRPHPSAGATLLTARPPLAAFNVVLAGATLAAGRAIADELREAGGGMPGVRAIAIDMGKEGIQISTNVHDPAAVPLGRVVAEIERLAAPHGARPAVAELIGVVPEAALAGYPPEVPIEAFDPAERTIEARLRVLR